MIHSPWFGTHQFWEWHLTSKGGPFPFPFPKGALLIFSSFLSRPIKKQIYACDCLQSRKKKAFPTWPLLESRAYNWLPAHCRPLISGPAFVIGPSSPYTNPTTAAQGKCVVLHQVPFFVRGFKGGEGAWGGGTTHLTTLEPKIWDFLCCLLEPGKHIHIHYALKIHVRNERPITS